MRKVFFFISLVLLVIVFAFTSCSGCSKSGRSKLINKYTTAQNPSRSPTNKSNTELAASNTPLTELFKKFKPAVFIVYTSDGVNKLQGSGFFISSDGIAVSNYHVFEGTKQGLEVIKLASGDEFKVEEIIAKSKENDYIVFKVRSYQSNVFFTPAKSLPEIGESVFAIGNPQGLEHTLSTGIISGYRENQKLIQTTTEITHGSSGGPLLNMKGEVIGITTAGYGEANLNFAVNILLLPLSNISTRY